MEKNFEEAIKWWKMAAEAGNAEAMLKLGNIYFDDSYEETIKAAERKGYRSGYEDAMANKPELYTAFSFPDIGIGSVITFGNYPQKNDKSEPIDWLVLKAEENKALVISVKALDAKPYHKVDFDITWEKCTLRQWLNNDFLNKAFSAEEQRQILLSDVKTARSKNTKDKIFLLSFKEAEELFKADGNRVCYSTEYAAKNGCDGGRVWWWLRSPGRSSGNAAGVYSDGNIYTHGNNVNDVLMAIRPAFYLNLNS